MVNTALHNSWRVAAQAMADGHEKFVDPRWVRKAEIWTEGCHKNSWDRLAQLFTAFQALQP